MQPVANMYTSHLLLKISRTKQPHLLTPPEKLHNGVLVHSLTDVTVLSTLSNKNPAVAYKAECYDAKHTENSQNGPQCPHIPVDKATEPLEVGPRCQCMVGYRSKIPA